MRAAPSPYRRAMTLDPTGEETAALIRELHDIVENDPYPVSPRIRTMRGGTRAAATCTGQRALAAAKTAPPRATAARRRSH
jgi:hypothetical protein